MSLRLLRALRRLYRLYAAVEVLLLRTTARDLTSGEPTGATVRRVVRRAVARLEREAPALAVEVLDAAREDGARAARAELAAADPDREPDGLQRDDQAVLDAAVRDLLTDAHRAILRTTDDAYRRVVVGVVAGMNRRDDPLTRLQAAQQALDRLADEGITLFADRSGRRWELASYVEMAVRTASARTAVDAHVEQLAAGGHDLVYVSDAPGECGLCRPWEHRVLSITGASVGRIEVPSALGSGTVTVEVAGSLAVARLAGLFHPNCRHSVSLFVPGATRLRSPAQTAQPEVDTARAHLRYLERQVRRWKRRQQAAVTPDAAALARRKVRDYQARIRAHVDTTPAKRQSQREQITRAR